MAAIANPMRHHPELCSVDGCSEKFFARGFCRLHYNRNWRAGSPHKIAFKVNSGRMKHPLYRSVYRSMKRRCYNPNCKFYPRYGGRGITICDRWLGVNGFDNFLKDMGPRPSLKHSIDRIDNDKGYSPENCRWADSYTQQMNKSFKVGKSGIRGVTHHEKSNKWSAHIGVRGKSVYLGIFGTKEEAAAARSDAEKKYVQSQPTMKDKEETA